MFQTQRREGKGRGGEERGEEGGKEELIPIFRGRSTLQFKECQDSMGAWGQGLE